MRYHAHANKIFWLFQKIFVLLQLLTRVVSFARKALLITVPTCKFGKFHEGGRSILLSLVVYAILISIPSGVKFVPWKKPDGFYSVPSEVAETHK